MKQSGFPEFWLRSDMQLRCRVLEGGLEAFEHGGGHRGGGGRAARPADLWDTEFGEQRVSSAYRGPLINGGPFESATRSQWAWTATESGEVQVQ